MNPLGKIQWISLQKTQIFPKSSVFTVAGRQAESCLHHWQVRLCDAQNRQCSDRLPADCTGNIQFKLLNIKLLIFILFTLYKYIYSISLYC